MNLYLKGNGPFPRMPLKVLLGLPFSSFGSLLIAVENEPQMQIIDYIPINDFQPPSLMNYVYCHGQQAGSISVNANAVHPLTMQLPVRPDYHDTIVIGLGKVANSQGLHRDHLAPSSVDNSHIPHINTPNKGPPCDIKFRSTVKPTGLLRRSSTASTQNTRYDLNFDGGPQEMRNQLVELESVNGSRREKLYFSKEPKANVTSDRSRNASNSRRTHEAKFTCPFEGCNSTFTRKHNLDSERSMVFDIMSFWSS